jgi:hypothetical protein
VNTSIKPVPEKELEDLLATFDDIVGSVDEQNSPSEDETTLGKSKVVHLPVTRVNKPTCAIDTNLVSHAEKSEPNSKTTVHPSSAANLQTTQDHESLVKALSAVVDQIKTPLNYPAHQVEYMQLSIALNRAKLLAPGFRPYPKNLYGKSELKVQNMIQRDRIMIDLHWLHERGEQILTHAPEWASLFNVSKPFDEEKAREFARYPYPDEIRTNEILSIPHRLQFQLRAMCGKDIQQRIKDYSASRRQRGSAVSGRISEEASDLKVINHWADKKPVIRKHINKHKANAKAQALMSLGPYSFSDMCELSALMRGEKPEDLKNFKANLASFNRYRELFSK